MQEVFEDGSVGEIKTADTLEELLPMIKESLSHPRVKYVKVFNNGRKVQSEEERTTNKEEMDALMGTVKKEDEIGPLKKVTRTFPSGRRSGAEKAKRALERADGAIAGAKKEIQDQRAKWPKCPVCKIRPMAPWNKTGKCSYCQSYKKKKKDDL